MCNVPGCSIPYGKCHCGCGKDTSRAKQRDERRGVEQGDPHKYLTHHYKSPKRPQMQGFWECVEKTSTCWLWVGKIHAGYGEYANQGRWYKAHRMSYMETYGSIPKNTHLHHKCGHKNCVRHDHLEPLTPIEHIARHWTQRTHCLSGHLYTEISSKIEVYKGRRVHRCLTCRHDQNKRRYQMGKGTTACPS